MYNFPYWESDNKDITASGTPEQLPDIDVADGCRVTIIAKITNTGYVYLGPTSATAIKTSSKHITLSPGMSIALEVGNVNEIWADVATSGEGVEIMVEKHDNN